MTNAERLRALLAGTVTPECDRLVRGEGETTRMMTIGEAIKYTATGQVLMISRRRVESILRELEKR